MAVDGRHVHRQRTVVAAVRVAVQPPWPKRPRRRAGAFAGWQPTSGLEPRSIDVAGTPRTYWLAKPSEPGAPLLVVFHGLGMNGKNMAAFTGLAQRGPALGFAVVFPDGWDEVWDGGGRLPGRDGVDDPGFIRALVAALIAEGVARDGPVSLVGISNGALFAEHLGRHALLAVSGLVLVSGTTTKASRNGAPRPGQQAAVLCFEGTGDPTTPYEGGRIGGRGFLGMITAHRARQRRETGDGRVAVAAERVALDGAAVNGGPGGPQQMPSRLIGPIPSDLDATGIMLEMARAELGWPGPNASTT